MRRTISLIAFVSLAVSSVPGAAAPAEPPLPAAAGQGTTPDASVAPADYASAAQNIVSRLEVSGTTIRAQLQAARAQRDIVKTLCLNDKLNQIDVTIRGARERKLELDAAMTRGDHDQGGHELAQLTVLRQRGDRIAADAYACLGGDPVSTDTGAVHPFIDPNLPTDVADYPVSDVVVEPPACSSCIK